VSGEQLHPNLQHADAAENIYSKVQSALCSGNIPSISNSQAKATRNPVEHVGSAAAKYELLQLHQQRSVLLDHIMELQSKAAKLGSTATAQPQRPTPCAAKRCADAAMMADDGAAAQLQQALALLAQVTAVVRAAADTVPQFLTSLAAAMRHLVPQVSFKSGTFRESGAHVYLEKRSLPARCNVLCCYTMIEVDIKC
jgi:hypothetical protein